MTGLLSEQGISRTRELSDEIAIAMITCYGPNSESDHHRAVLAKDTIGSAIGFGYKIFVVDSGSSDEFLGSIERLGASVHVEKSMNYGEKRRRAIQLATDSEREIVVAMEAEKADFVKEILTTTKLVFDGVADLVVPRRKSIKSYPTAQQLAEPLGNLFWKELTGYDLDIWFGPRVWNRDLSNYFLDYGGEHGDVWDSIFIPVMDAIVDGKRVVGVDVDYRHPQQQTEVEEQDLRFIRKRIIQLENLTDAMQKHYHECLGK